MQFTTAAITAILSASAVFAAPVAVPNWTFEKVHRLCSADDSVCTWYFDINQNNGGQPVSCAFRVEGEPASQASLTTAAKCSRFSVTTGWSGQFGAGNGFTTLAVHDDSTGNIAWPAYTDAELEDNHFVSPDRSYPVSTLSA